MSEIIMRELQPDYLIASSKLLADVTSCDSVWGRRLLLSALAVLNPKDPNLCSAFATMLTWVETNDPKFNKMTVSELKQNSDAINMAAVVRYYDLSPDGRTFVFDYRQFIGFWENSTNSKKYHTTIRDSAERAMGMNYAHAYEIVKGKKTRAVNKFVNVFSMIEVDGFETITVKLVADFMPYLVFLNKEFTKNGYASFPIMHVIGKKSVAALIMSQLALRMFKLNGGRTQSFTFDMPLLRQLTGCEDTYTDASHFRKRIVEKGIKEINEDENGGFKMEIDAEKTKKRGKKITHLTFKVTSESLNVRVLKTPKQVMNQSGNPVVSSEHSFFKSGSPAAQKDATPPPAATPRFPFSKNKPSTTRGQKTKEELLAAVADRIEKMN
jgi:plasmid replication initiation protein